MSDDIEKIKIGNKLLRLELGDITRVRTDAIVNAANEELKGGGGVDAAIHKAAGPSLMLECERHTGCPTGSALLTAAGNLPVRHVIHTVGPVWKGGEDGEAELLSSAYLSSLELANKHFFNTVAFPSISTGAYGYPKEEAARIALTTVKNFLEQRTHLDEVLFVLYDEKTFLAYQQVLSEIQ